jgi:hypothetical protein
MEAFTGSFDAFEQPIAGSTLQAVRPACAIGRHDTGSMSGWEKKAPRPRGKSLCFLSGP